METLNSVQTNSIDTNFVSTDYYNHACAIFEGFYESSLFNSDTLYYMTENDRGETQIDQNGNEVPILKDNESWDFTGDNYDKFQIDVAEYAVQLLEELATEYKEPDQYVLRNFKLHNISSPQYYNYSTDKLHIDMEVNVRALEDFCFNKHSVDFNNYLKDNFTSYDGFLAFIDNNIIDFNESYKGKGIDSSEGNCMIEYYLLSCIYETTDMRTVHNMYQDDYRYHMTLFEYANNECIWQYVEPVVQ